MTPIADTAHLSRQHPQRPGTSMHADRDCLHLPPLHIGHTSGTSSDTQDLSRSAGARFYLPVTVTTVPSACRPAVSLTCWRRPR
jgi:hypothetical protein